VNNQHLKDAKRKESKTTITASLLPPPQMESTRQKLEGTIVEFRKVLKSVPNSDSTTIMCWEGLLNDMDNLYTMWFGGGNEGVPLYKIQVSSNSSSGGGGGGGNILKRYTAPTTSQRAHLLPPPPSFSSFFTPLSSSSLLPSSSSLLPRLS